MKLKVGDWVIVKSNKPDISVENGKVAKVEQIRQSPFPIYIKFLDENMIGNGEIHHVFKEDELKLIPENEVLAWLV